MRFGLKLTFLGILLSATVHAAVQPGRVYPADNKKTQNYIKDGMIVGGDRAVSGVQVSSIRHAVNAGYERMVIDLEGTVNGEAAAIPRAPYYQVAVNPEEKRLVFTIWGNPRLKFNATQVTRAFKRSRMIDNIELLPRLEDTLWTFVIGLKSGRPVEIFELSNPVRIIVDIKN
jgi:hypothetical protein